MRKVTVLHKFNTVKEMRNAITFYTQKFFATELREPAVAMYAKDIARAAIALNAFIETSDAAALHNTIVRFDTEVREEFVNVLLYIEKNELVPQTEYCTL
jgi:hypothetical protein